MLQIPPKIEIANIFNSHSTDSPKWISYFEIQGFPIYNDNGVKAYISYGIDLPTKGGRDLLYDKDVLLDINVDICDDTSGPAGKSLLGEINCLDITVDGEILKLAEPFKMQVESSSKALYVFALLKNNLDKILNAKKIGIKIYGTNAFFEGSIDHESFYLYSLLFSKLADKRKDALSHTDKYCFMVFPDSCFLNDELSDDKDLAMYEEIASGDIDSYMPKKETSIESEKPNDLNPKPTIVNHCHSDSMLLKKIDKYLTEKTIGDEFVGNSFVLKFTPAFFEQTFADTELQNTTVDMLSSGNYDVSIPRISIDTITSIMRAALGEDREEQSRILDDLGKDLINKYILKYTDYRGGITISNDELEQMIVEERSRLINGLFQHLLDYETETARKMSSISCHLGIEESDGTQQVEMLAFLHSATHLRKINDFQFYAISPDGKRHSLAAERIQDFNYDATSNAIPERIEKVNCYDQVKLYRRQNDIKSYSAWGFDVGYSRYIFSTVYRIPLKLETADSILLPGTKISVRFNDYDIRGSFTHEASNNWNIIKLLLGDTTKESLVSAFLDNTYLPKEKSDIDVSNIKAAIEKSTAPTIPGLDDNLKHNLELQKEFPANNTCTDIHEETNTVNIQVCKTGMCEGEQFDPLSDKPGIDIVVRFLSNKIEDTKYWDIFKRQESFYLFTINEVKLDDTNTLKECYVDYGDDYVNASRLISTIIKDVYGIPTTTKFSLNTWTDGGKQVEEQITGTPNNPVEESGLNKVQSKKRRSRLPWVIAFILVAMGALLWGYKATYTQKQNNSGEYYSKSEIEDRVFEAYKKAIDYILNNYTREYKHSQTGGAIGEAVFNFSTRDIDNSTIKVTYAYPNIGTASETGDLSNWELREISNKKDNYPYVIMAHWAPYGSGDGTFKLYLSRPTSSNSSGEAICEIKGDGWVHQVQLAIPDVDYVVKILRHAFIDIYGVVIDESVNSNIPSEEEIVTPEQKIAIETFESVINYALENATNTWSTSLRQDRNGKPLSGNAVFEYDFASPNISVTHSLGQKVETETGQLKSLRIENTSGFANNDHLYPVSIQGRWELEDSEIGDLKVSFSKENIIVVYIDGYDNGGWLYGVEYTIDSLNYIIDTFNSALDKQAKLNGTEAIKIIPINEIESESESIDEVVDSDPRIMETLDDYPISERLLTEKDIQDLSKNDLRLLRNTIFARHGRIFKDPELSDYFSLKQWYHPQYEDVSTMLSEIELKNSNFLYEEELKNNYLDTDIESMSGQKKAIPIDTSEVIIQRDGVSYYLHKVLSSETIHSICRYYDVTQQELYDTNKDALESGLIVGMYLLIPYHKGAEPMNAEPVYQKEEENAPIISSDSSDSHVLTDTDELLTHKVKWNENLYSIAKKYGVDPALILRANHLTSVDLKTGQVIIIPTN